MKFSTREDIEAPIETVFRAVTDFAGIERQMTRRGIEITRDEAIALEPGATWRVRFDWRGRSQDLEAELISVDEGQGYAIESRSGGVVCLGVVDLLALSAARTRLFVSLDLKPTTLSSRLLIQSLKLAKPRLNRRFSQRIAEFASVVGR